MLYVLWSDDCRSAHEVAPYTPQSDSLSSLDRPLSVMSYGIRKMSRSFSPCLLLFYAIIFDTSVPSLNSVEYPYCCTSDTSVQSWATTTQKLRAQHPTRMDQVRSKDHSGKAIDDAHRFVQLYRPSLAA